jgi:hypothetical protein
MDLSTTKAVTSSDFGVVFGIETDPFRPDWNRIFVNYPQSASAGVQAQIILTSQDSFNITSIPGATTSGFDLCHVQLESGSGMSSPIIVTAGSAPTVRAADVLKASGAWYKIANYSLGFQFRRLRNQPSLQQLWMTRDTANAVNGVSMTNGVIGFDTPANAATMSQETVGTGSQTAWQIPNPQLDGPFPLVVSVDGVVQAVGSYTLGTTSFSFSEAPPPGSLVDFRGLGGATMVAAQSVGTGSQTAFTAPTLEGGQAVIAMIDGVVQATSAYTLSGQTVTFSEAVPPGSLVDIRSVSSVIVIMEETAPGGLTTFTLPTSATSPKLALLVVIDGLLQPMTSYTVTLNKLVFSQAPPSGALVDFRIFTV